MRGGRCLRVILECSFLSGPIFEALHLRRQLRGVQVGQVVETGLEIILVGEGFSPEIVHFGKFQVEIGGGVLVVAGRWVLEGGVGGAVEALGVLLGERDVGQALVLAVLATDRHGTAVQAVHVLSVDQVRVRDVLGEE